MLTLLRTRALIPLPISAHRRCISTTPSLSLDQKWRRKQGLTGNPNEFGPLTNLPDYTYMDGRPTPIGLNLMRRLERQKTAARQMVEKISELDFAKSRYARMQQEKQEYRERTMGSKLKPKGPLLFKK